MALMPAPGSTLPSTPTKTAKKRTRCRATSLYLSPDRKVSLLTTQVYALIGDKRLRITDRRQVAELMQAYGWNGTVEVHTKDGIEVVVIDPRLASGHLPANAAWWRMRQVIDGASADKVGGPRQLAEVLFGHHDKQLGKAAMAALRDGRGFPVAVLSATADVLGLSPDELTTLLRQVIASPLATWWQPTDPRELQAVVDVLAEVAPQYRLRVVTEFLTSLPAGTVRSLAREWHDNDALATLLVSHASWDVVYDLLRARSASGLPLDYADILRSRSVVGMCALLEVAALSAALLIPELAPAAAQAYLGPATSHLVTTTDELEQAQLLSGLRAVMRLHPEAVVDALAAATLQPRVAPWAATMACELLEFLSDPDDPADATARARAVALLTSFLTDPSETVRATVFSQLGRPGLAPWRQELVHAAVLTPPLPVGREASITDRPAPELVAYLQTYARDPQAATLLAAGLAHSDMYVVRTFAAAFSSFAATDPIGTAALLDQVVVEMSNSGPFVAGGRAKELTTSLTDLAAHAPAAAVPVVQRALASPRPPVRQMAYEALPSLIDHDPEFVFSALVDPATYAGIIFSQERRQPLDQAMQTLAARPEFQPRLQTLFSQLADPNGDRALGQPLLAAVEALGASGFDVWEILEDVMVDADPALSLAIMEHLPAWAEQNPTRVHGLVVASIQSAHPQGSAAAAAALVKTLPAFPGDLEVVLTMLEDLDYDTTAKVSGDVTAAAAATDPVATAEFFTQLAARSPSPPVVLGAAVTSLLDADAYDQAEVLTGAWLASRRASVARQAIAVMPQVLLASPQPTQTMKQLLAGLDDTTGPDEPLAGGFITTRQALLGAYKKAVTSPLRDETATNAFNLVAAGITHADTDLVTAALRELPRVAPHRPAVVEELLPDVLAREATLPPEKATELSDALAIARAQTFVAIGHPDAGAAIEALVCDESSVLRAQGARILLNTLASDNPAVTHVSPAAAANLTSVARSGGEVLLLTNAGVRADVSVVTDPHHVLALASSGVPCPAPTVEEMIAVSRRMRGSDEAAALVRSATSLEEVRGALDEFPVDDTTLSVFDGQRLNPELSATIATERAKRARSERASERPSQANAYRPVEQLHVKVIRNRTELLQNKSAMGNCTDGYGPRLNQGSVLVALCEPSGVPAYNAYLEATPAGWRVGEVNSVHNRGGAECEAIAKWLAGEVKKLPPPTDV